MKFVNRKHGLALYVQTLPGQKRPSLLIADELGYKKVASFIKDEDADDFVAHLDKMLKAVAKDEP